MCFDSETCMVEQIHRDNPWNFQTSILGIVDLGFANPLNTIIKNPSKHFRTDWIECKFPDNSSPFPTQNSLEIPVKFFSTPLNSVKFC